jgi:hypothetical protein
MYGGRLAGIPVGNNPAAALFPLGNQSKGDEFQQV